MITINANEKYTFTVLGLVILFIFSSCMSDSHNGANPSYLMNNEYVQTNLTYTSLTKAYPQINREDLFRKVLGGGWPKLLGNEVYRNTCCIRLSVALNQQGDSYKITSRYSRNDGNHKDGSDNHILVKVPTMQEFLDSKLGQFYWGMSKKPGTKFDESLIKGHKGIILYKFNDNTYANGHVDLWDGNQCLYSCPELDVNTAAEVQFWKLQ